MDFLDRWFPKGGLSGQPQVDARQEAIDQYQKMMEQQQAEQTPMRVKSMKHQYGDAQSVSSSPAGPRNRTRGMVRAHHRPGRFTEGE